MSFFRWLLAYWCIHPTQDVTADLAEGCLQGGKSYIRWCRRCGAVAHAQYRDDLKTVIDSWWRVPGHKHKGMV